MKLLDFVALMVRMTLYILIYLALILLLTILALSGLGALMVH